MVNRSQYEKGHTKKDTKKPAFIAILEAVQNPAKTGCTGNVVCQRDHLEAVKCVRLTRLAAPAKLKPQLVK